MESLKIQGFRNSRAVVDGPFWTLFEAVRMETGAKHLVQVLDESLSQNREFAALAREALHVTSGLHHEAILRPHALEEASGRLIFVYDFFNARSLQSLLDARHPFVERRVITIVRQIAEAFQHAQIRGVRHGWLSPKVVLLEKYQDEAKVFGFGADAMLAYLYDKRQDIAASVNPYIPPENLALATQPAPDDCYALGVLFYQLLLGKMPFAQEKIVDLKQEKCSTILPPNKQNPKISHAVSDMALSLLDPRQQSRAGLSSLLNVLRPQMGDDIHVPEAPAERESGLGRVRGLFRRVNPVSKDLVGSKKRIVYVALTGAVFLTLLLSIILFTHLSSRDEQRFQRTYDEFVAEQRIEPETAVAEERLDGSADSVRSGEGIPPSPAEMSTGRTEGDGEVRAETTISRQQLDAKVVLSYADLVLLIQAGSEAATADVFVNGRHRGQSGADGRLTIANLVAEQTYTIRVEKSGFETWQQRIRVNGKSQNSLDVVLAPTATFGTFVFERVQYADKIRLNEESMARNLPCTLQLPFGPISVTFIDSRANFSWSTSVELREDNQRIAISAERVGVGEVAVTLEDASRFGYAFVQVDEETGQYATPFRKSLTAGWHRIRISRADYAVSPADTLVFIRPERKINIHCKML